MTPEQEVRRYLKSGDYDILYSVWPGSDFLTKARKAERTLKEALVGKVRRRAKGRPLPSLPPDFDSGRFCLGKVGPMVDGLFPAREREIVLDLFEKSLVFITHDNIEQVITEMNSLETAWNIANIYMGSLGVLGLDGKPACLVGLSKETNFFVSMAYFEEENPFADYVVHEAAHVFHNWKRAWAGLPYTRKRQWLLQIDFIKREIFAYACEAYSRILEHAKSPADRRRLHADYEAKWIPTAERPDRDELVDILTEAVTARNGWKRILQRCSPPKHTRSFKNSKLTKTEGKAKDGFHPRNKTRDKYNKKDWGYGKRGGNLFGKDL